MAQYRASVQGSRGEASRLGGKTSGIDAQVNGWRSGVSVCGRYNEEDQRDEFAIFATGGSGGRFSQRYLGTVQANNGRLEWIPAEVSS